MSKEKLLLVGAGGFGRMAAEQAIFRYDCAFVDDGQRPGTVICGIPVIGGIADLGEIRRDYNYLVVCIGSNKVRAGIYEQASAQGYSFPNIIAESVYISPFAHMGVGCVVLQNACIQNGAVIGNGVLINSGVEIHCDALVHDYALVYSNSVIRSYAQIGRFARIGSNVTISNNRIIPENADVQDGVNLW